MNKTLGNFELVEQIDPGGYTTVYRAVEQMGRGITRPAAVKILQAWSLDDEAQLEILRREVEVLVELGGCPNIITIYRFGIDEELGPWIGMELGGRNLKHFISAEPAEPDQVRVLLRDALRAMSVVHGADPPILHRDLKPNNILSTHFGIWKIVDFGLAYRQQADDTLNLLTVQYAAPELLDAGLGEASPAMDLYSLGMVAYEYALGRSLHRRQFPSVYDPDQVKTDSGGDERPKWMYWHTSQQMTVPPIAELIDEYPEDLSDLIAQLTAKPIEDRIGSADEALVRLGDVQAGLALPAHEMAADGGEQPRRLVPPLFLALAALVIVIAIIVMMILGLDRRPEVQLVDGGVYSGNAPTVLVAGNISRFPRSGSATVTLPGGTSFPVYVDDDGGFTSEVRVPKIGETHGMLSVMDRSGKESARKSLFLERLPPRTVEVVVRTRPAVSGARVVITDHAVPDQPLLLRTDESGTARVPVSYGTFDLEVTHARFNRVAGTSNTGIDPVKDMVANLAEISKELIYREMRRKIDRIKTLARRKADCELTEEGAEELERTIEELRQLAEGDPDIEDFIAAVRNVRNCDPDSFAGVEEAGAQATEKVRRKEQETAAASGSGRGSTEAGPALVVAANVARNLIERIKVLARKKAECEMTEAEAKELERSVEELGRLGAGDPDIEGFIVAVRNVKDCDPSTLAGVEEAGDKARRTIDRKERESGGGAGTGGGRQAAGSLGSSAAAVRKIREVIAAGGDPRELIEQIGQAALLSLPMDVFRDFIEATVPAGALAVEIVPHVDKVRISGPVFDQDELVRLLERLAPARPRLAIEVRLDAWAVCRRLQERLATHGVKDARTHAYLARGDHVLYVQFTRSDHIDDAAVAKVARTFVIDRDILHVADYAEP